MGTFYVMELLRIAASTLTIAKIVAAAVFVVVAAAVLVGTTLGFEPFLAMFPAEDPTLALWPWSRWYCYWTLCY